MMDLRRFSHGRRKKRAVSEVLGALLLMLVVVVAVGTFAFYLSSLQQQTQNRNSFQQNLANEKLKISSLSLFPNDIYTQFQFRIFNGSSAFPLAHDSSSVFYVDFLPLNSQEVRIYNFSNIVRSVNASNFQSSRIFSLYNQTSAGPSARTYYNQIASGVNACINLDNTSIYIGRTTLGGCTIPGGVIYNTTSSIFPITFQSAVIDHVNMTIQNLNTQQSGLQRIQINNNWLNNWTEVNQTGHVIVNLSPLTNPAVILARESIMLTFNVTAFALPLNASIFLTLLAPSGNYFSSVFSLAPSLYSSNTVQEQFGQAIKGIVNFQATTPNSSAISQYLWRIDVPTPLWTTSKGWGDSSNLVTVFATGQEIPLSGDLIGGFNMSTAQKLASDLNDPIRVSLISLASNGMEADSASFIVPANSPIGFPASLTAVETTGTSCGTSTASVLATVTNSLNVPYPGVAVSFTVLSGSLSFTGGGSVTGTTGLAGTVTMSVVCSGTASGTVSVSALDVNPVLVVVS
jgi:flagellin-like protein